MTQKITPEYVMELLKGLKFKDSVHSDIIMKERQKYYILMCGDAEDIARAYLQEYELRNRFEKAMEAFCESFENQKKDCLFFKEYGSEVELRKRCEQLELQNERLKESVRSFGGLVSDLNVDHDINVVIKEGEIIARG